MKRLNPIGSLFGVALTVVLFIGLGSSLIVNRGLAFNPGKLTSINKDGVEIQGYKSHAEFEGQCKYCHEPLKSDLSTKCVYCHTGIQQQIIESRGVHNQIDQAITCSTCHGEHRGRSFNPTTTAYTLFDHSKTSFSLYWHQQNFDTAPMQCGACHKNDSFSFVENHACLDCHGSQDDNFSPSHIEAFGSNCQGCHEGTDRMQKFDHKVTGFPLEYKHSQINCTDCHKTENLSETPRSCVDCHAEPSIHQGLFKQNCDSCHTAKAWSTAQLENKPFTHSDSTRFSLILHQVDYENQNITCITCHPNDVNSFDLQTCIDCHSVKDEVFVSEHIVQFGSECMNCHDGVDRLSNFDHANFFTLDGKHEQIQCNDCHAENVFKGTPTECWQCHQEPEIHTGVFGLECSYCHNSDAWSPAQLEQHTFPLNHGLGDQNSQLSCDTCHVNNYVEYTCYTCHEHTVEELKQKHLEENINEKELPDCIKCHSTGTEEG